MNEFLLTVHHVTSVALSLICWWLAHQNARAFPPGRLIAFGYAVTGMLLLIVAFARESNTGLDMAIIGTKLSLIMTFVAVSYRRHKYMES